MNKAEFLTIIGKKLAVLQESEISDIIGEYSQHIDMKISEGMTEDEAINTLGDIDELTDGILSAYHVNTGEEKNSGIKRKFGNIIPAAARWAGKILAVLFTVIISLGVLFMLFMAGVCIVLLTQGYPLSGVFLALMGIVLILGAVAVFCYRMLIKNNIRPARVKQVICIMLIAGVFIGGIGTGMVLAEYSSYEYINDVYLPDSKEITKSIDYEVSWANVIKKHYGDKIAKTVVIKSAYPELCRLVPDVRVQKNHISADITYFAQEKEILQPRIYENEAGDSLCLYSGLDTSEASILEYKDILLDNLREHKFGRYCVGKVTGITIRVNPESEFSVLIKTIYESQE